MAQLQWSFLPLRCPRLYLLSPPPSSSSPVIVERVTEEAAKAPAVAYSPTSPVDSPTSPADEPMAEATPMPKPKAKPRSKAPPSMPTTTSSSNSSPTTPSVSTSITFSNPSTSTRMTLTASVAPSKMSNHPVVKGDGSDPEVPPAAKDRNLEIQQLCSRLQDCDHLLNEEVFGFPAWNRQLNLRTKLFQEMNRGTDTPTRPPTSHPEAERQYPFGSILPLTPMSNPSHTLV